MKQKWYISGLNFECTGCGRCCQGPDEGYIWATEKELGMIAEELEMGLSELKDDYTIKVMTGRSLVENPINNDCIFLQNRKSCEIYSVRPNQCRTWPFWDMNLRDPDSWNEAGQRCPGINQGRKYSFEEIEKIRKQKSWWSGEDCGPGSNK